MIKFPQNIFTQFEKQSSQNIMCSGATMFLCGSCCLYHVPQTHCEPKCDCGRLFSGISPNVSDSEDSLHLQTLASRYRHTHTYTHTNTH